MLNNECVSFDGVGQNDGELMDDSRHIVGRFLGGSGGKDGVLPQFKGINRGQFRTFETQIANTIKKKELSRLS